MSTFHYCPNGPEAAEDAWVEGPVSACPHHARNRNRRRAFKDPAEARRLDRQAGVVGEERKGLGYIHGT